MGVLVGSTSAAELLREARLAPRGGVGMDDITPCSTVECGLRCTYQVSGFRCAVGDRLAGIAHGTCCMGTVRTQAVGTTLILTHSLQRGGGVWHIASGAL